MFTDQLEPFCRFAKAHLETGDIDPMYPVLKHLYEQQQLTLEQALWRTLLYVTWYHIGSAEKVWTIYPEPPPTDVLLLQSVILPTGTERRGFRGNVLAWGHLAGVMERARTRGGSLASWLLSVTHVGGTAAWDHARDEFQAVPYGGFWSSYKWADLLKNVIGYDIVASDIGVGGGGETAGPVPGMVRVTGEDWRRCARDVELQKTLLNECIARGVRFNGLDQLETSLCDFNSLCKGGYYVGHDIDVQMNHLEMSSPALWEARAASFKPHLLGEVNGWWGVRKQLKPLWRDGRVMYGT
jgi:hypothetical protein